MATIDLQDVLGHRAQVEAFQRKHRIGLLTLMFTDIVGSTRIKQDLGDAEGFARIQAHHAQVRELLEQFPEGEEISTAGDSFFLVFAKPSEAVRFALVLQSRLRALAQATATAVFDRIGIHIGEVIIDEQAGAAKPKDLYGIQVDICARVMSAGDGDQVLMTRSTFDNARQVLKGKDVEGLRGLVWLNHGTYSMHGVEEPLELCEVGEEGLARLRPPPDSGKVRRFISATTVAAPTGSREVVGRRPASGGAGSALRWVAAACVVAGLAGAGVVFLRRTAGASGTSREAADASPTVVERLGFEPGEGYTAGQPLIGQRGWVRGGWTGQLESGGQGVATGVFGAASSQHAFIGGVGGLTTPGMHASLSRPLVYTPADARRGTVQITWKQRIQPSTDAVGNLFEWLFYNQSRQLLCGVIFDNSAGTVSRRLADNSIATTPLTFEAGQIVDVTLRLDLENNRWSGIIGGGSLPPIPIAQDNRPANLGGMAVTWRSLARHAVVAGPVSGDNVMAFDDVVVTARRE